MKQFRTKYGYFPSETCEYVITRPDTPRPWVNVISNGDYGVVVSQTGSGYSWRTHASLNRITRWDQDLIKDEWGKFLYVRDRTSGDVWSVGWKPVCAKPESYLCRHGIGYTVIESKNHGIKSSLTVFVPNDDPVEVWKLTLTNTTRRDRRLSVASFLEWCLGAAPDWHREFHKCFIETEYDAESGAVFATKRMWEVPSEHGHWNTPWPFVAFHSCDAKASSYDCDKESFLGRYGNVREPYAVVHGRSGKRTGRWFDPVASLSIHVVLRARQSRTIVFLLGAADGRDHAVALAKKYKDPLVADQALDAVRERWQRLLGTTRVETPDAAMNLMLNTWLKYQGISGRLWARTAYYQMGGAFGFRDQLQDSQILLPIDPEQTKCQLRLHARHQFKDGSVYHWWHPLSEIGHSTAMTDDMLWLPFVVNSYLMETADFSILDAEEPFVDDATPTDLYGHCVRAIEKALSRLSSRGLPLIGAGDWNDALSAVGLGMKGESVWLGHFLHLILKDFAAIAEHRGDSQRASGYCTRAGQLKNALNMHAWDGAWYYRATKDNGEKLGSSSNVEGKIYLNAQVWAVIAGVADEERTKRVLDAVEKHLEYEIGPLLLHPAYSAPDEEIGYLTRYSPGMRENGGVYTHAATWAVLAEVMAGRSEEAYRMFSKINPVNRGCDPDTYVAEPYVTPGNIEGPESPFFGRGGWTWYTGSAAWLSRVGFDWILGVRASINGLIVDPCIPRKWSNYRVNRRFRGSVYDIEFKNPNHVGYGVASVSVDGVPLKVLRRQGHGVILPLSSDSVRHHIIVLMGEETKG